MKRGVIILTTLLVGIGIILTVNRFLTITHTTTTNFGMVVNKEYSPYSITLRTLTTKIIETGIKEGTKDVKIIVKDEDTWNSIEKGRCYFVIYSSKNTETPVLRQIEINDRLEKMFKDKLNK